MGQRRLAKPQADDANKRPAAKKQTNNTVLNHTNTRKGEVFRAQRRTSENVNLRASQHLIDIPVNKSVYNGYKGEQSGFIDGLTFNGKQPNAYLAKFTIGLKAGQTVTPAGVK